MTRNQRHWRIPHRPAAGSHAARPEPAQTLERQEQDEEFRLCIHSLPATCQKILQLRFSQHLSFEEMGACLDVSPEAARKLCARALFTLGKVAEHRGLLQADRPGGA